MRVILLSFFSLFLLQCSTVPDPNSLFLKKAYGLWYISEMGSTWLNDTVGVPTTTTEGDTIFIQSYGNFSTGGFSFTFVEIESTGVLAVYSFTDTSAATKYIGIGFNAKDEILFDPSIYSSVEITPPSTGSILLTR